SGDMATSVCVYVCVYVCVCVCVCVCSEQRLRKVESTKEAALCVCDKDNAVEQPCYQAASMRCVLCRYVSGFDERALTYAVWDCCVISPSLKLAVLCVCVCVCVCLCVCVCVCGGVLCSICVDEV